MKSVRPQKLFPQELSFAVDTPAQPGDYVLEIDMLQENVTWFGLKGSRTYRTHVTVVDD